MEDQLKKLKSGLKDELDGFEFDARMKRNVSRRFVESGKPRGNLFRRMAPAGLSLAFLAIFSVGIYWVVEKYYTENHANTPPAVEDEEDIPEFNEAVAATLLDRFTDTTNKLKADADDNKLDSYSDIEEVHALFDDFMARDAVERIFEDKISENQDGVYFNIKVGIPSFSHETDFTLEKTSETEYKLVQYRSYDGDKLTAVFKYNSDTWKIDSLYLVEKFNEEYALALLSTYDDILSDNHFSRKSLNEKLESIMSIDLISQLNLPVAEDDNGRVHVQGTDTIPTFWEDTSYKLEEVSEEELRLTQIQQNDMSGNNKFAAVFKVIEESWKIASLTSEPVQIQGFDEKKALELLERYDSVIEAAYEDASNEPPLKFRTYKTKEEFYQLFLEFMSYEFVESNFSFRLEQKDDGLYVIPMDGVQTYWPDHPYDFKKITENEYHLTQFQESELFGRDTLTVIYKNSNGKWKIDDIVAEPTP